MTLVPASLGGAEGFERGGFHERGNEGDGAEDVGELGFGQAMEARRKLETRTQIMAPPLLAPHRNRR